LQKKTIGFTASKCASLAKKEFWLVEGNLVTNLNFSPDRSGNFGPDFFFGQKINE
jgi:hypothetical protein